MTAGDGPGPVYRDSLANERTFLAWLRTSLALTAGSVAVVPLSLPGHGAELRWLGALLAVLAGGTALLGLRRWTSTEQAMRAGAPLPSSAGTGLLAGAAAVLALVALTLALTA